MTDTLVTASQTPSDAGVSDRFGEGAHEEETRRYERSPRDVLRLAFFALISIGVVTYVAVAENSVLGLEEDVIRVFDFLSPTAERILGGALQWFSLVTALIVLVVPLVTRRYRLFAYVIAAAVLAFVAMLLVHELLDRANSEVVINRIADRAGVRTWGLGGANPLALFTASFVALGPFVTRRWRRAGATVLAAFFVLRLVIAYQLPAYVVASLPVGALCGVIVLLILGRPDRRPTLAAVTAALVNAGIDATEVRAANVDARGSTPYFASLADGRSLFVKVLGEDERAADLLFRFYRFLRFKDIGDDRPFSSLRRTVEHEALVSLMARDIGVRTPHLQGVVAVGADSMLLGYEAIEGSSFDKLADDQVTDELMRGVWAQVALLRARRIAHRDLRRANLFMGADGQQWIIDFGFSELAVTEHLLDSDVAQLLASFTIVAGPQRSVAVAIDSVGRAAVAQALPRLQARALSGATATALKEHKGLLKELQQEVMKQCAIEDVHYEQLQRVNRKTVLMILVLAGATYFLLPQFADLPAIADQIKEANFWWAVPAVVMSFFTYVGAAGSLTGAISQRLPAGPTFAAEVGSSFVSKIAPAGLGGMALNIRYLQKQGVDRPVAISGVGLNTVGGLFAHLSLVGVFLVWAGRRAFGTFKLPNPKWVLVGLGVVLVLGAIAFAFRKTRQLLREKLVPILSRALVGIGEVARKPSRIALLLGGSAVVTMSYILSLYFCLQAFGGGLPFATVGAVYLVGAAVAQAAPTPGGLGALEAALIAGLVAAGLHSDVAVPAVFLYRLCTFWLPILPGWIAFRWLQRKEYI